MQHFMCLSCRELETKNYENQLLQFHSVPIFLPYEIRELNLECEVYYRLNYRTTLKDVLGHLQLDLERVKNMVKSIVCAMETVDNYLLSMDQILWKSEYIFVEADTGKLQFCYYPDNSINQPQRGSVAELVAELLQVMDRREEDVLLYLMSFYNYITDPNCDVQNMNSFIGVQSDNSAWNDVEEEAVIVNEIPAKVEKREVKKRLKKNKSQEINEVENLDKNIIHTVTVIVIVCLSAVNIIGILLLLVDRFPYEYIAGLIASMVGLILATIVYMNLAKEETPDEMMQSYFEEMDREMKVEAKEEKTEKEIKENIDQKNNEEQGQVRGVIESQEGTVYGETTLLVNQEEEMLSQIVTEEKKGPYILASFHKDKYPEITILSNIIIGRMRAGCNYILKEKDVSRMHAKICYKPTGELYVMDMNSRNGTFLNGERIAAGEEIPLTEGDALSFANCEFYLRR